MTLFTVLGATGGAGFAITNALHHAGLRVRAVNRRGDAGVSSGVERVAADIERHDDLQRAVAGSSVVFMAAQPPYHRWPELFPPMLENVIAATGATGAKLVMVDNAYGYGPGTQPMTEDSEERAQDAKGRTRRRMTGMLLEAHRQGRVRVAIGRASDYFGPGAGNSAITALAVAPALRPRGDLRWLGSLDAPHSVAYVPDIARAYVTLGTDDRADGEIWHLPHVAAPTGRAFLETVNRHLGEPRKVSLVGAGMLRLAAPFHRVSRESLGILYQWREPFILDCTKYEATFGVFDTTPLELAIAETLRAGAVRISAA